VASPARPWADGPIANQIPNTARAAWPVPVGRSWLSAKAGHRGAAKRGDHGDDDGGD